MQEGFWATVGWNGLKISGLTLRRMLEAAVGDGANQFRLQKEVTETGGVNADIGTLLIDGVASRSRSRGFGLLAVGWGGLLCLELLVRVVDEILLGGHFDC